MKNFQAGSKGKAETATRDKNVSGAATSEASSERNSGNLKDPPGRTPMRTCSQCHAPDHEILQPGADSVHFVVPEIRYLERSEDFKEAMRLKGWKPRLFNDPIKMQRRPAIERDICRNCLNDNDIRDEVWGEMKRAALALEKPKNPDVDYYRVICEA